jgi:transcription initiation factor TFIIIB Brf1 subunit/transcription initiation factor TFIIB
VGRRFFKGFGHLKGKRKKLMDKKNIQLDPSRKWQERTTKQKVKRRILQVVNKQSPGNK